MLDNDAQRVANLDPRDTVGGNNGGDYKTLIHIKYLSSGSHGFRKEEFF